jgi:hypothetical protein
MTKDTTGAVSFDAVPCNEVSKREKALAEDYAQACKAYKEAKKDNPSEPKPGKPAFLVLEKTVPGKDKAEARVAFWREKYEAKKAGKTGTDGGKPTETEKDNKPS